MEPFRAAQKTNRFLDFANNTVGGVIRVHLGLIQTVPGAIRYASERRRNKTRHDDGEFLFSPAGATPHL